MGGPHGYVRGYLEMDFASSTASNCYLKMKRTTLAPSLFLLHGRSLSQHVTREWKTPRVQRHLSRAKAADNRKELLCIEIREKEGRNVRNIL